MEDCTQVIDISDIGFDISELGRVKVGTLIINETPYDIFKGENVIGRSELSDIVLRSNSISSKHAVLEVEDWETHLLFDCGSTNKTRLGTIFLKPNVRYNLQGGEDIMFADFKAKYVKLDKPETDQHDEDSTSEAGSESLLNSVPADLEADLNIVDDDQSTTQAENNPVEEDSHIGSDLNDSSLLEENKQKPSSSRLQVVDASDDSTDDEADFIPPSQTVKEFASKKQLSLKKRNCIKETSRDMFSTEKAVINTQDQDLVFMTENVDNSRISNSLNLNTQSLFSSEVQESTRPKDNVCDQSIFEAETQESNFASNKNENGSNRASRDIFDAETEIPGITAPVEDIEMSNLELSNALTEPSVDGNKPESSSTVKVKEECQIRPFVEEKPSLVDYDTTTTSSGNSENEDLDLSNALTEPSVGGKKSGSSSTVKFKEECQIKPFVEEKPLIIVSDATSRLQQASSDSENEDWDLSNALTQPSVHGKKLESSSMVKVKEECQIRPFVEEKPSLIVSDATSRSQQASSDSENEDWDLSNALTEPSVGGKKPGSSSMVKVKEECQIRPFVEVKPSIDGSNEERSCDSENEEIFNVCTQVNTSLKGEPLLNIVVKEEISIKSEPGDIGSEETQVNFNLQNNSRKRTIPLTEMDEQEVNNEGEETQPNLLLFSSSKVRTDSDVVMNNVQTEHLNQHGEANDSDNTDVEEDLNEPVGRVENDNNVPTDPSKQVDKPATGQENQEKSIARNQKNSKATENPVKLTTNCSKTIEEPEIDDDSNNSDSLLASVPLDFGDIDPDPVAPQPTMLNCSEKGKENDKCKSQLKSCQTLSQEVSSNKNQQELTTGEMDICSTVGDGTYLSACGSTRKPQNSSKVVNSLQNSTKKITSGLLNTVVEQKKVSETESLNHSMVFNEPCGSSTPFPTNQKVISSNKKNMTAMVVKTPPRAVERIIDSPDLPLTEEIVEVACKTPDREGATPTQDSSRTKENLPLALKRTPRARKLSRKVAEALEEEQKGDSFMTLSAVCKNKSTTKKEISDHQKIKDLDNVLGKHEDKKGVKRKISSQPKVASETPENKSNDIIKQKHCVKNLSITLNDVSLENSITAGKKDESNEHSPAKRAKNTVEETLENPLSTHKNKPKEKKNAKRKERKPAVEVVENIQQDCSNLPITENERRHSKRGRRVGDKAPEKEVENKNEETKPTQQDCSNLPITENERRHPKRGRRVGDKAPEKEVENKNEETTYENTSKLKSKPETTLRKSSRRKNEGVSSSDKESVEERESFNAVKPISELRKSKSKDNLIEPEARTRKSNRKRKEEVIKSDIKSEAREAEVKSELLNENDLSLNKKNKITTKRILSDESVKDKTLKLKSNLELNKVTLKTLNNIVDTNLEILTGHRQSSLSRAKPSTSRTDRLDESVKDKTCETKSNLDLKRSMDASLENSNIANTDQNNVTRGKKPSRSRVKPARFREKEEIDGSDSSLDVSDKGPSTSKRRKGKHDLASVEKVNSKTIREEKKSKKDESGFISPSNSIPGDVRKHSEIFKTPGIEDRSRSRHVESTTSRSRSKSNSSQGSLRSDTSSLQSPRRPGARGKCVLFTSGLANPTWESQVRKLGGSVVECPLECSLLVADKVRRTVKFLCVLGQGKPIVTSDWLTQSWRCTSFIEPMEHLLADKEAEAKFKFSLSRTIQAARKQPLLKGFHVYATPSVKPPPEDIKSIVESCGGQYLENIPSKWPENIIVISHVEDKSLWKKMKVKGLTPPIVSAEMLLIGVLQHRLEIEPHRIA